MATQCRLTLVLACLITLLGDTSAFQVLPTYTRSKARPDSLVDSYNVSFPGDYQESHSAFNWDYTDPKVRADDSNRDGIHVLQVGGELPVGKYHYRVVVNGVEKPDLFDFTIKAEHQIYHIIYDQIEDVVRDTEENNLVFLNAPHLLHYRFGLPIMHESVLSGMMLRKSGDLVYTHLHIPQGMFEYGLYFFGELGRFQRYAGTPFRVPLYVEQENGVDVAFVYNTKTSTMFDSLHGFLPSHPSVPMASYWDYSRQFTYWDISDARKPISSCNCTVSFPGNYAGSMINRVPGANWAPGDPACFAEEDPSNNGIYSLEVVLPIGSYEFKAALHGTWEVNYGEGAMSEGRNLDIRIKNNDPVWLLFDYQYNFVYSTTQVVPIVVSNFMENAGYGKNWDVNNLAGWMKPFSGPASFSTHLHVPYGKWNYKIGFFRESLESKSFGYSGSLYTIPLNIRSPTGMNVVFIYNPESEVVVDSVNGKIPLFAPQAQTSYMDTSRPEWNFGAARRQNGFNFTFPIITFPGSYASVMSPTSYSNWNPGEAGIKGQLDPSLNGVYSLHVGNLPAGNYEYKVTWNWSFGHNYGPRGVNNGKNIHLSVRSVSEDVYLFYDIQTNMATSSLNSIPIVVGDFFEMAGYGSNWNTSNLSGWMQNSASQSVYAISLHIPPGTWQYRIGFFGKDIQQNSIGLANTEFDIPLFVDGEVGQDVVFVYNPEKAAIIDSLNGPMGFLREVGPVSNLNSQSRTNSTTATSLNVSFTGTPEGNKVASQVQGSGVYIAEITATTIGMFVVNVDIAQLPLHDVDSINVTISTAPTTFTLYFDYQLNKLVSSFERRVIVIGDFMEEAGYGSNWDESNLNGIMISSPGGVSYYTALDVPPGEWKYQFAVFPALDSINEVPMLINTAGIVSLNVSIPAPLNLKHRRQIVFAYEPDIGVLSDTSSGFPLTVCKINCLNGGECRSNKCKCTPQFTGEQCQIETHYSSACLSTRSYVDPVYIECEYDCVAGYRGRECTLLSYGQTGDCVAGWYGPDCSLLVPITGGSSLALDLGNIGYPWALPPDRGLPNPTFDALLYAELERNNAEYWNRFWDCKKTITYNHPANPFRHLRTIEMWVYLPLTSYNEERHVPLLDYCGISYGFRYDGHSRIKLTFEFGPQKYIISNTASIGSGRFMNNGASKWTEVEAGKWHHFAVVLTYEGNVDDTIHLRFLLNGIVNYESQSTSSSYGASGAGGGFCDYSRELEGLFIGKSLREFPNDLQRQWTKPVVDEVRMWTISRSDREIRDTMHRRLLEHEIEQRNNQLLHGMPACFVYLPLSMTDHRASVGSVGSQWAGIDNQARIIAVNEGDRLEGYEDAGDIILAFHYQYQDALAARYNKAQPIERASTAPVVGWEHEIFLVQGTVAEFSIQAQVMEYALQVDTCVGSYTDCVDENPGAFDSDIRGSESIVYPSLVDVSNIDDGEQVVATVLSITYEGDASGSLVYNVSQQEVQVGDSFPVREMRFRFTPSPEKYSKRQSFVGDGPNLYPYLKIHYQVNDTRALTVGNSSVSSHPEVKGEIVVRVQQQFKPVVGSTGSALRCKSSHPATNPYWAVAQRLPLNPAVDTFTVELWFSSNPLDEVFPIAGDGIGGTIFSLGGQNRPDRDKRALHVRWDPLDMLRLVILGKEKQLGFMMARNSNKIFRWFHLAVAVDNSVNGITKINLYLDSELLISTSVPHSEIDSVDEYRRDSIYLCDNNNDNSWAWVGYLDEIRIWNTVRTSEQIKSFMFQELSESEIESGSLEAYWDCNKVSKELVRDRSGNQRDLVFGDCSVMDNTNQYHRDRIQVQCANPIPSTMHIASNPGRYYSLATELSRPRVVVPSWASPVRQLQHDLEVQLVPGVPVPYNIDGMVPDLLDCGKFEEWKVPQAFKNVEGNTYYHFDAQCRSERQGREFEIVVLPDPSLVVVRDENSNILTSPGVVRTDHGPIQLEAVEGLSVGGSRLTHFEYRTKSGSQTSLHQRVDISLLCPPGHKLMPTTGKCKQCEAGTYLHSSSLFTECCDPLQPSSGCYKCRSPLELHALTNGTAICRCASTGLELEPRASFAADSPAADCHVCGEKDYRASFSACDPHTNKHTITYNATTKVCPPIVKTDFVDCSYLPVESQMGLISFVVLLVGFLSNFAMSIYIVLFRRHPVIRLTQPTISFIYTFGSALFNCAGLTLLGENTDASCKLRVWSLSLSFTIMFTALFAKVWKVWKLFAVSRLEQKLITNMALLLIIVKVTSLDIVILSIWEFASPTHAQAMPVSVPSEIKPNRVEEFVVHVCNSESEVLPTVSLLLKICILFYGVKLSWESRNLDERFSEAKYIAMAIFYMFTLGGLCYFVSTALGLPAAPSVQVQTVGIMLCSTVSVALIFVPKMLLQLNIVESSTVQVYPTPSRGQGVEVVDSSLAANRDMMLSRASEADNVLDTAIESRRDRFKLEATEGESSTYNF